MTAALKHFITLVWFTAVLVIGGMYAFDYMQRTVEETKSEIMGRVDKTLNAPMEAVTTTFSNIQEWGDKGNDAISDSLKEAGVYEETVDFFAAAQDNLNWLVGGDEFYREEKEKRDKSIAERRRREGVYGY